MKNDDFEIGLSDLAAMFERREMHLNTGGTCIILDTAIAETMRNLVAICPEWLLHPLST